MPITYSTAQKSSTPKTTLFEKSSNGPLAFAEFISNARVTNSPRGDFIADTKTLINCGRFPLITSWSELYCFMSGRHACPEAIAVARSIWREYQKSQTATVSPEANRRADHA